VLLVAGCNGKKDSGEKALVPLPVNLSMAGVVDEADALAWAGQIEGQALEFLLRRPVDAIRHVVPGIASLQKSPGEHRGAGLVFSGKLVSVEKLSFRQECARLGKLHRGVVLLEGGRMVAFICRAERAPTKEAVGAGMKIPVRLPPVGSAVTVRGRFLKRWAALDAAGRDYVVLPLFAASAPQRLSGTEAEAIEKLKAPAGKLPLKPIEAPEVWRRPVVQVEADGSLRLDGARVSWDELHEKVYPLAAKYRNPLGDSALAVVVLADPRAPRAVREKARKFPSEHGAKGVFRLLKLRARQ
jgi:hypothetical protein